ncbi:hypothetical protein Rhe02_59490 [Rhizocola hellebori]|uniref:Methylamine utilisation protein MauE domain-containing protein n=1 Tax=Rhizocola hellebori TaxID=1392758 RepID=A0A8J3QDZ8_9ACTN|nr:MauE/DoxX family redox-associated membrane protein [Rhizocola hellebori]GIH07882.1 hypothetical protein Rhe02_59490 [Rhizocola hellebori]
MKAWQQWLGLAARVGLGAAFLAAGAIKVTDLAASARAVNAYQLMPWEMAQFVGVVQPVLEIGVGLLLLAGLATRLAASLAALAMVAFIAGIASAWARGLSIDCGCFSRGGTLPVGQNPNYAWDIARDVALLALAIYLVVFPVTKYSLDRRMS